MSDWWQSLNSREQRLVSFASVFLLGACIFLFALEPLAKERKVLDEQLQAERQSLSRIEQYANEASAIRSEISDAAAPAVDKSKSFLSILNHTSSQHSLQDDVKRIVPNGVDKASVVFDKVAFDLLANWLIDLQTEHYVTVARITVDKTKDAGLVRANVNLVR